MGGGSQAGELESLPPPSKWESKQVIPSWAGAGGSQPSIEAGGGYQGWGGVAAETGGVAAQPCPCKRRCCWSRAEAGAGAGQGQGQGRESSQRASLGRQIQRLAMGEALAWTTLSQCPSGSLTVTQISLGSSSYPTLPWRYERPTKRPAVAPAWPALQSQDTPSFPHQTTSLSPNGTAQHPPLQNKLFPQQPLSVLSDLILGQKLPVGLLSWELSTLTSSGLPRPRHCPSLHPSFLSLIYRG